MVSYASMMSLQIIIFRRLKVGNQFLIWSSNYGVSRLHLTYSPSCFISGYGNFVLLPTFGCKFRSLCYNCLFCWYATESKRISWLEICNLHLLTETELIYELVVACLMHFTMGLEVLIYQFENSACLWIMVSPLNLEVPVTVSTSNFPAFFSHINTWFWYQEV